MFGAQSSSTRSPSWGAGSSKRRRFWRARVSPVSWVVPSWTTRPSVSRTTSSRWRGNEWDCSVRPRPISTTSSNSRPTPSFVYYLPATPHKQKCLNSPRLVKFHSSERVVAMKNYFVILPQNFAKNTWSHRKSSQFFERWILFKFFCYFESFGCLLLHTLNLIHIIGYISFALFAITVM